MTNIAFVNSEGLIVGTVTPSSEQEINDTVDQAGRNEAQRIDAKIAALELERADLIANKDAMVQAITDERRDRLNTIFVPEGMTRVDAPDGVVFEKGGTWIDGVYTAPEPVPEPVPQSVPMWAAKVVCEQAGIWDNIQEAVQSSGNPVLAAAFAGSPTLSRDSNAVLSLKDSVNLTDDELDAMFRLADALASQV